jgi:hypothetical protein
MENTLTKRLLKLFASMSIILMGFCQNTFSQDLSGRIWVFSDSCGIDFRDTNNVVPYYNVRLSSSSSSAAVSTPAGNLAFYTDNRRILDGFNHYVLNYDSLIPGSSPSKGFFFRGTTDTTIYHLIIQPNQPSSYLSWYKLKYDTIIGVFIDSSRLYVSNFVSNAYPNYANYGIKTLKMDAVKHGNGRDWWIVAQMARYAVPTTDSFVIFSFFNDSLYLSHYQQMGIKFDGTGELDISNDGSKISVSNADTFKVVEFEFDRCTGMLSNPYEVYNSHTSDYNERALFGLSYSKSGEFIYGVAHPELQIDSFSPIDTIYQFNPRATVDSLKYTIIWYDTNNVISDSIRPRSMELGDDGNIYVNYEKIDFNSMQNVYYPILSYMGVIRNADQPYPNCYFDPHGIFLGTQCQANGHNILASVPNYNLGPMIGSPCDTLTTTSTGQWLSPIAQVRIFPNPAKDKINISWPIQGGYTWILKSLAGCTLISGTQQAGNATISTAHLPEGMYFLEVHSAKEHKVEKVIIVR